MLLEKAEKNLVALGDKIAYIHGDRRFTYFRIDGYAAEIAAALARKDNYSTAVGMDRLESGHSWRKG